MIWPDDQFEVTCRLDRKRSLSLLRGAAGIFAWDAESGRISIGRTDVRIPDSTFDLRLVVDGSVVEAFAGERGWITGRVYAQRASIRAMGKPDGIRIYSLG
jgi:hypothetical protein